MKSGYLDRNLGAFKLAAPFAMAARTADFAHCVEASLVGARVLSRRNIDARAVPCCVVGANTEFDPPVQLSLGLSAQDIYKRLNWESGVPTPFEEWLKENGTIAHLGTKDGVAMHMAIVVRRENERVIVDPTIGQLRGVHRIEVPFVGLLECEPGEKWAGFSTPDGWNLQYDDSPHAEHIEEHAASYQIPNGWVEDLDSLMQLAISCKLDDDRFFARLEARSPSIYATTSRRIGKLARGI